MTRYEHSYGSMIEAAPAYICSKTEFERATTAEDGSTLVVIDEAADKVDKYCVAFKKRWRDA